MPKSRMKSHFEASFAYHQHSFECGPRSLPRPVNFIFDPAFSVSEAHCTPTLKAINMSCVVLLSKYVKTPYCGSGRSGRTATVYIQPRTARLG